MKYSFNIFLLVSMFVSANPSLEKENKQPKQYSILYPTSCNKGHINPNSGIARELTSRGHHVDMFVTGLCEDAAWRLVPGAREVIALDLHPEKCLDPGDLWDMIAAARDLYIEKHTIQAFNETFKQLQRKKYDVVVSNFIVPGGIIAAKVARIPVVASTVGPMFILFKEEAENWDFDIQVNLPYEDSLPEFITNTVRIILSISHFFLFSPIFSFIQEQHSIHGLNEIPDTENDGSLPFSYYYRHTVVINQGLPEINVNNMSNFYEEDNVIFTGFIPDTLLYPNHTDETLLNFIENSNKPLIFISLGTVYDPGAIPQMELMKQLEHQTEYKFVWAVLEKYDKTLKNEQKNGDNLFIGSYLPQGKILMHQNTKIFLTHCGANSVQDGIHAMKPMLTYPGFGDQVVISKRIVALNIGRRLRKLTFLNIKTNLDYMLDNDTYNHMLEKLNNSRSSMVNLGGYKMAADVVELVAEKKLKVNNGTSHNLGSYDSVVRTIVVVSVILCFFLFCMFIWLCTKCFKLCSKKMKPKKD